MKRQYHVGLETNKISAAVNTGTRGIAYTALYQVRSGGQSALLAESTISGSGDVPPLGIGQGRTLAQSYIVVRTLVDFSHIVDADERANDVRLLVISYTFAGGFSGTQVYNFDNDDITVTPDKKLVVVTKAVEMLQQV